MELKGTPLGSSNFGKIICENRYYVDKTLLVRHILNGADITCCAVRVALAKR